MASISNIWRKVSNHTTCCITMPLPPHTVSTAPSCSSGCWEESGVEWTPHPSPGPSTEESPSRGSRHQLMVPRRGREDEGCGAGARATTTYVKYKYWPSPAQIVDIWYCFYCTVQHRLTQCLIINMLLGTVSIYFLSSHHIPPSHSC